MAVAVVQIEEVTGPAGAKVYTVKDDSGSLNSRYYTADHSGASLTTYPIPIPNGTGGGVSGSYWKTHCLAVTSEPSVKLENIRFYVQWTSHPSSQWTLGYGGDHIIGVSSASIADCRILTQGFSGNGYDEANGVQGEFGYLISGQQSAEDHTYYSDCANGHYLSTWAFSSQAGALMVYSGQAIGATTGRLFHIVTQVKVASGATQGAKDAVTATWVYDEV